MTKVSPHPTATGEGSTGRPRAGIDTASLHAQRDAISQSIEAASGLVELPIMLVDLEDLTVRAISHAALEVCGLPAESVIGRPVVDLYAEDDREVALVALEAMRGGVIDFYRGVRSLDAASSSTKPVTIWSRAVQLSGERLALAEVARDDGTDASPLQRFLRRPPSTMVLGTVDASWVITAVSSEIEKVLGLKPEAVIGRRLLGAIEQGDVQCLLDASRLLSEEYSVARQVRMRDGSGSWRALCCVLTSLATTTCRSFMLIDLPGESLSGESDRVARLEQHLVKIAAEIDASGILQRIGKAPDPARLPQLANLTVRQWEVLFRLMRGERVATIAEDMYLSPSTVRNHLSAIFERFGVHSQAELLAALSRRQDGSER